MIEPLDPSKVVMHQVPEETAQAVFTAYYKVRELQRKIDLVDDELTEDQKVFHDATSAMSRMIFFVLMISAREYGFVTWEQVTDAVEHAYQEAMENAKRAGGTHATKEQMN